MLKNIKNKISKNIEENGLSKFLQQIRKFPLLTFKEESALANDWVKNRNSDSAHTLVNSHLRLVVKIAMGYRGYGLPLAELISEGNVGMIQSLERFDPSKVLDSLHTLCGGLEHPSRNIFSIHGH